MTADGLVISSIENSQFEKIPETDEGLMLKMKRLLGINAKVDPPKESKFCIAEAYVAVSGATLEVGYNVAFLVNVLLTASSSKIKTWRYHAAVWIFGVLILLQ